MNAVARRSLRFAFALALALGLLGGVELILRAAGYEGADSRPAYRFLNPERNLRGELEREILVPDPDLFWRFRPNVSTFGGAVESNSHGFRTPCFELEKPPGVYRVIVVGDSISFGLGVNQPEPWPRLLEDHLRAAAGGDQVEVLNLGLPGYSSHQGRVLLERATAWSPDLVVVAFGAFNDWVPAVGRTDAEQREGGWLEGLRLFRVARSLTGARDAVLEVTEGEAAEVTTAQRLAMLDTREFNGARRVPLDDFRANLTEMAALARAGGAAIILLSSPLPRRTILRNPASLLYADAVHSVATELGCPWADGWGAFAASGRRDSELFLDFCHPTVTGQALLAETVTQAVRELPSDQRPPSR